MKQAGQSDGTIKSDQNTIPAEANQKEESKEPDSRLDSKLRSLKSEEPETSINDVNKLWLREKEIFRSNVHLLDEAESLQNSVEITKKDAEKLTQKPAV